MKEEALSKVVKRTQKDYSYTFKVQVVQEIESGSIGAGDAKHKYGIQSHSTVLGWLRKFGNFDWTSKSPLIMSKSPQQKLMELEQKVRLLEKQKNLLEKQVEQADKKTIIFDMVIDFAEKEYNIPIRKNS